MLIKNPVVDDYGNNTVTTVLNLTTVNVIKISSSHKPIVCHLSYHESTTFDFML